MDKDTLVLLIDESSGGIEAFRRVLGDQVSHLKLRRVPDVPTALARIWGGGVDLVVLSLPAIGSSPDNRLAPFRDLQAKAEGVPVVVLCASADQNLAEGAMREGAADYLLREAFDADLLRVLRSNSRKAAPPPLFSKRSRSPANERSRLACA